VPSTEVEPKRHVGAGVCQPPRRGAPRVPTWFFFDSNNNFLKFINDDDNNNNNNNNNILILLFKSNIWLFSILRYNFFLI
jgi:hypothetical protein